MDRAQLEAFLKTTYPATIDHPWAKYPDYEVFRHSDNKKWFALIMNIPKSKLGIEGEGKNAPVDVVNFKCEPALITSLLKETGIYPAYHMNKANWISVALDGSADAKTIKILADMSYQLTSTTKL